MNTHDIDIELPPLHRPQVPLIDADIDLMDIHRLADWCEKTAKKYARAAIEADRKRRGEPVAWVAADTLNSPHPGCVSSLAYVSQIDKDRGREYVPLYAAPVATQGEDDAWCAECGVKLENVRPGKHQHPTCSQAAPQQPAAVGEEIMVNTPYDVFTLPLQPSGLSSGPRFVVHVPAPEQQSAAVAQSLTDEHKAILKECRNQAMRWTLKARIPEAGAFSEIAQDLDYLCEQLGIKNN